MKKYEIPDSNLKIELDEGEISNMKKNIYFISYHSVLENGSSLFGNIDIKIDNVIDDIEIIREIEKYLKTLLKKETHSEIKGVVILNYKLLKEQV